MLLRMEDSKVLSGVYCADAVSVGVVGEGVEEEEEGA